MKITEHYLKSIPAKREKPFQKILLRPKVEWVFEEYWRKTGLKKDVEKRITKGGKFVSEIFPKYKLITARPTRRSYASNLVRNGRPIQAIMRITGHTKEATFNKYVKLSEQELVDMLS